MEIIKEKIENILREANYIYQEKYQDDQLNSCYNYVYFLNKYEEELRVTKNLQLADILYSKYYWFSRLADRFHQVNGSDAGIDQQQDMIIDEMDQRLEDIDWNFVERLTPL